MTSYTAYEERIVQQLLAWELEMLKPPGKLEQTSRHIQKRIHTLIPEKVHNGLTAAVKGIVQSSLFTASYIPGNEPLRDASLEASDEKAAELLSVYQKIAAAEGAGTGAGGFMLALVDFPALIGIKIKYLYETAHVYGYTTEDYRERLFILYVFQLAFSGKDKKMELLDTIKGWNERSAQLSPEPSGVSQIDWQQLQQEYRDTIDFRKMLQLIPGIGAVVGAWANFDLLDELGEVGMNAYRLRRLLDKREASAT